MLDGLRGHLAAAAVGLEGDPVGATGIDHLAGDVGVPHHARDSLPVGRVSVDSGGFDVVWRPLGQFGDIGLGGLDAVFVDIADRQGVGDPLENRPDLNVVRSDDTVQSGR